MEVECPPPPPFRIEAEGLPVSQYILRLVGQVIAVSLETGAVVRALPPLGVENAATT